MIVSDELKLIFIHIPKNAGTYITNILYDLDPNIKHYIFNGTGHILAKNCIRIIGAKKFYSYRKFCVVRNIYDKTHSYYNYIKNTKVHNLHSMANELSFFEFISEVSKYGEEYISIDMLNSSYILNENGEVIIDYILKFENLHEDLTNLFINLGLDISKIHNIKVNSSPLTENKNPYKNAYGDKELELIRHICKKDIEYFSFEF